MKKLFLLFISLFSLSMMFFSCNNKAANSNPNNISPSLINIPASANAPSDGKLPKLVFTDTTFDFGNIKEGDKVTHVFTFKNEGQGDLIIASATASCGCTIPTYPHQVKHPGDTGTISIIFDSSNKTGKVTKAITVVSNTQPPFKYLIINANIQPLNN